jgi:hypothetical protein
MENLTGYILAGSGLVLLVANLVLKQKVAFLNQNPYIVTGIAIALIILGAFMFKSPFSFGSGSSHKVYESKEKHIAEEVPIYEGDKIVGYRKHKN